MSWGVILEAVGPTQDMANEIVGIARQAAKNGHYDGKLCDEGCFTFPYSPSDIPVGPGVPVQHAPHRRDRRPPGDVPHRVRGGLRGQPSAWPPLPLWERMEVRVITPIPFGSAQDKL